MSRILIIRSCKECPHFIKDGSGVFSETCKKTKFHITYDLMTKDYPIPTNCPLEEHSEFQG